MTDIALSYSNLEIDIDFNNLDLITDDGLRTSILISLFTDARCTDDELPDGHKIKRGFWGDMFNDKKINTGSKIWLLEREKTSLETKERIQEYAKESLAWMVDEGIASKIETTASIFSSSEIKLEVKIYNPGKNSNYDFLWSKEGIKYEF